MFSTTMLDVGQGEAILLDFPDDTFALLDGGPTNASARVLDAVSTRVNQGKVFLFAAATQWDADHIGGLPVVLRTHAPKEFVHAALELAHLEEMAAARDGEPARKLVKDVWDVVEDLGICTRPMFAKSTYPLGCGQVELSVLGPYTAVRHEVREIVLNGGGKTQIRKVGNRASLVFWCSAYGRVLFFPGEVEDDQYPDLAEVFRQRDAKGSDDPRASWVKLSHHGGRSNNPIYLFQVFCAKNFVASGSTGGQYGHPHPIVLRRLHFECGGQAMCTRLGQGCDAMISDPSLSPTTPEAWLEKAKITRRPNPHKTCFGDIRVQISAAGTVQVSSQTTRHDCPYGGPASGMAAL